MKTEMDVPLDNPHPQVQVYAVANSEVGEYVLIGPGHVQVVSDEL